MNLAREVIIVEITEERDYQNGKWGTSFDDKNTLNDWSAYMSRYLGLATFAETPEEARRQLVKVAALAIAAIETFDRNSGFAPRHYDKSK